jgi:ABC-type sugar transport system substrate-binding protein
MLSRSAAIAAALAVGLALTGCGDDDDGGGGSSGGSSGGGAKAEVAFVYPTTETNFGQEMAMGAEAAAGDLKNVDLTNSAPNNVDGPKQVQLFQTAVRSSKDGVAMMTLTPDLFLRPLLTAGQQGVPLIAVDVPPAKGAEKAAKLLIGNSNEEIGADLAKSILDDIPEDASGEVLIGTDTPGLPVLEQRNKGFMDTMKTERPNLKMKVFDAKQSPTDNFNTWSSQVKANPDAVAYVGPGSQAAVSLTRIQKRNGKKLLVAACDLDQVALQGVKDGYVKALISPEHFLKTYLAITMLANQKQKGDKLPEGIWNSGSLTVNSDNIDEILKRQGAPEARAEFFRPVAKEQLADPDSHLVPMGG